MLKNIVLALLLTSMLAGIYAQTADRNEPAAVLDLLQPATDNMEIYAIPVGQGDCTLIQCPTGELVVNDCGSSGGNRVSPQNIQAALGTRINPFLFPILIVINSTIFLL